MGLKAWINLYHNKVEKSEQACEKTDFTYKQNKCGQHEAYLKGTQQN